MPKLIPDEQKRVTLNCLVAPATLRTINDLILLEGRQRQSRGSIVDRAVALLAYGEEIPTEAQTQDAQPETQPTPVPTRQEATKPTTPKVPRGTESVAQRKAREAKEHAEALAKSDFLAQAVGRDDIDYDLENVPHRPVGLPVPLTRDGSEPKPRTLREPKVYKQKGFGPLTRPHGGVEPKRKRDQG